MGTIWPLSKGKKMQITAGGEGTFSFPDYDKVGVDFPQLLLKNLSNVMNLLWAIQHCELFKVIHWGQSIVC
jgi:hypothetical protein